MAIQIVYFIVGVAFFGTALFGLLAHTRDQGKPTRTQEQVDAEWSRVFDEAETGG